jgi:hypothetical protein
MSGEKKRFVIFGYEQPAVAESAAGTVPATYTADVYMSKKPISMDTFKTLLTNISSNITAGNVVLDDNYEFISSALSSDNFGVLADVLKQNNEALYDKLNAPEKKPVVQGYITGVLTELGVSVPYGTDLDKFYDTYDVTTTTIREIKKPKLVNSIDLLSQYDKWLNAKDLKPDSNPRRAYDKLKAVVDIAIKAYNAQSNKAMMGGSQTRSLRKKISSKQRRGTQRRL